MSDPFALTYLYDQVTALFAQEGTQVPMSFGWQSPFLKDGPTTRICWVPGDPSGNLGSLGPAKMPGRNPRSLGTLNELFTVYLVAFDSSAPTNERVQYAAARQLYDAWWRACVLCYTGRVTQVSNVWLTEKNFFRHGAALRITCTLDAMIPDAAWATAPVDAAANLTVDELDNTENLTVTASG